MSIKSKWFSKPCQLNDQRQNIQRKEAQSYLQNSSTYIRIHVLNLKMQFYTST